MGSEELEAPLLPQIEGGLHEPPTLVSRTWTESKKLWQIVAPAIFSRLTMYGINVISQAFAGHLGDLELASVSIATTVIVGLNFGLLLGMASALETLCGQAYGAKKYHMLGVYMQRSWIILSACALLLLPVYVFAEPILLLFGQPRDIAAMTGAVAVWFIPQHFSFVFMFPLQRFLQCQLKNGVTAYASAAALAFHVVASYLLIVVWRLGIVGIAVSLNLSWWVSPAVMFLYVTLSPGCARSWTGFSVEAFSGLWEFLKLSAASGVMLCLENWYYRVLVLLAGNMKNAQVAVDALSICMSINGWELMIPFAFFAGTGVRVANELGAGNGKGARFATVVSVITSSVIGLFFWALIVAFHDKFALIFTSSMSSSKPLTSYPYFWPSPSSSIASNPFSQVWLWVLGGKLWWRTSTLEAIT
ncbi:Protein TRANSPARENT TESTA 12 [Acorus calamus]|uniref:Protein TRANSPARENT TESTA 12 n=1 Tax=Acorus calamus TaxID=4465 RepID=A0AAV9DNQ9_ACOCL|nr:Protein TRANSPARENT TESTA 12 [Acorus calamus]